MIDEIPINISLLPEYFANKEFCEEVLSGLLVFGNQWVNLTNITDPTLLTRMSSGIHLTILNSRFKLNSEQEEIDFRKVLYIGSTQDISTYKVQNTLLPCDDENLLKTDLKYIQEKNLDDLELWFLSIPPIGSSLLDQLVGNMISLFKPPYNHAMTRTVKASTKQNKSIPAF